MVESKIIVAIDSYDRDKAFSLLGELDPDLCKVKIGSVVYNALGKEFLKIAQDRGFKIFLDLKLHDIPNTVYKTILGFGDCSIEMLTIHLSGGEEMINKAMQAAKIINTKIIGVSVLTSLEEKDSLQLFSSGIKEQITHFFNLANRTKIDGVVCSPLELELAKEILNERMIKITPGIREEKSNDDQARTMSAKEAIKKGSSYLVIGRPITKNKNISRALKNFNDSIDE